MPRHITVVYTIHDESAAKEEIEQLGERFQSYDPENPPAIGISAMSNVNEMRRLELIENATEASYLDETLDNINDLLGAVNLPE